MICIQDKKDCCGCSACVQKCPKHCISFYEDEEGFLYPRIDTNNCIDCGLCEKVCPFLNCDKAVPPQEVWAVKNQNESDRMHSSSGGVFIALAREVLAWGGVVFGAVFDENYEVMSANCDIFRISSKVSYILFDPFHSFDLIHQTIVSALSLFLGKLRQ